MSQITSLGSGGIAPGGGVQTITGNAGGAVSPSLLNNINIVGGGGVTVTGNPGTNTLTVSASVLDLTYTPVNTTPYVVGAVDLFLSVDSTAAPITVRLPNAPATGSVWTIKDRLGQSAINNITITTVGGVVLIDAAATYLLNTAYEAVNVIYNGSFFEVY